MIFPISELTQNIKPVSCTVRMKWLAEVWSSLFQSFSSLYEYLSLSDSLHLSSKLNLLISRDADNILLRYSLSSVM